MSGFHFISVYDFDCLSVLFLVLWVSVVSYGQVSILFLI